MRFSKGKACKLVLFIFVHLELFTHVVNLYGHDLMKWFDEIMSEVIYRQIKEK